MRTSSLCGVALLLTCCTPVAPNPEPILAAAQEYRTYRRVHDWLNWAPTRCMAPPAAPPKLSASRDPETHGRKLYHLYARHFDAYRTSADMVQPVGQVIVKEAWVPAATSTATHRVAGDKGPLFVMMKTGEPETDAGWIYATLTPDGKTITASGKLDSCMECHQSKPDRLFGVKSCAAPN